MQVEITAFTNNTNIPQEYTCSGQNISPEIKWSNAPEDTKSFVLIVDDPDAPAGNWVHWVAYNIPANKNSLPENITSTSQLEDGTLQGSNSFNNLGYGGPCPPQGHGAHRYFFKLYALDTMLDLTSGASKTHIEQAMAEHVIDRAETVGHFERN